MEEKKIVKTKTNTPDKLEITYAMNNTADKPSRFVSLTQLATRFSSSGSCLQINIFVFLCVMFFRARSGHSYEFGIFVCMAATDWTLDYSSCLGQCQNVLHQEF